VPEIGKLSRQILIAWCLLPNSVCEIFTQLWYLNDRFAPIYQNCDISSIYNKYQIDMIIPFSRKPNEEHPCQKALEKRQKFP
jgi:hypothetical protein